MHHHSSHCHHLICFIIPHSYVMTNPLAYHHQPRSARRAGGSADQQWDEEEILVSDRHHCVQVGGGGIPILSSDLSLHLHHPHYLRTVAILDQGNCRLFGDSHHPALKLLLRSGTVPCTFVCAACPAGVREIEPSSATLNADCAQHIQQAHHRTPVSTDGAV